MLYGIIPSTDNLITRNYEDTELLSENGNVLSFSFSLSLSLVKKALYKKLMYFYLDFVKFKFENPMEKRSNQACKTDHLFKYKLLIMRVLFTCNLRRLTFETRRFSIVFFFLLDTPLSI
jgi:hypothetical protein